MMDPKADPYLPFKNSLMPRGDPYTDPFYAYKMPVATHRPTYYYSDSGSPSTYSYGYEDITRGYTFDATAKLWRLFAPADQGEFGGFGLGIGVTQDAPRLISAVGILEEKQLLLALLMLPRKGQTKYLLNI